MGLSSGNNAVLFDKCTSLQNLTVTLQVTPDLIAAENNGFSLQLNCYPRTNPQSTYRGHAARLDTVRAHRRRQLAWVGDPVLVAAKNGANYAGYDFGPVVSPCRAANTARISWKCCDPRT